MIYSKLKPFRFPDRLEALAAGRTGSPVHIRVKPINACNDSCWYCAYRADGLELGSLMDQRDRLSDAKLAELAEDFIAMGVRAVTFSGGGEPLLHPKTAATARRLAEGGIHVAALTNGAFLSGETAEVFSSRASWVRVSMDAWDEESHIASRRSKPGEFGRIMDNLAAFAARGGPCELGVSFIVSEKNAGRLHEAARLIKDAGVRHLKLSACVVSNSGAENNAYFRRIAPEVDRQLELCRKISDASFSVIDHSTRRRTLRQAVPLCAMPRPGDERRRQRGGLHRPGQGLHRLRAARLDQGSLLQGPVGLRRVPRAARRYRPQRPLPPSLRRA